MKKFDDPMPTFNPRVLDGTLLTSRWVLLAVKRHEADLKRTDWEWEYDEELAGKAVAFMEMLPEPKTGKPQPLAPFQKFIIGSIYGWVNKEDHTIRRFTDAFITMARKNGKSLLISGIILFEFLFGKNPAFKRQLYTAANDRKQAGIVFNMVKDRLKALCRQDDEIKRMTKITRDEIINLDDGSIIRSFSRDAGLVDGYEPHVAVVDEYANAKTTDMLETLSSGQVLLPSYLTFIISTAGFDMNVPMFVSNYPYAKKVLLGEVEAERYFAFVAEQNDLSEIDRPETWIRSNPLLDVDSLKKQITGYLTGKLKQARGDGSLNSKLIKNFNMWRQAEENSYMDIDHWNAAKIDPIDIHGKKAWIGVDVGKTSDLYAISWLIPMDGYWYADSFAFVGTKYGLDSKIKSDRLDYRRLQQIGQCEITTLESGVIDVERVYQWLDQFVAENELDVQGICFDPAQYGTLLTQIEKGHPEWLQIQVRQGTLTLSMPTKQFRDDVLEKKIKHSGNEILTAAINNAVLLSDNNGVRIDKNKYSNKIDALDALMDAFAICFRQSVETLTDNDVFDEDFGF
ncbi:terminase large subunit [Loigolactobacillus coryniformis]|uniref:terminase large subunit n=1 Tax=Loigolactobacillus coryniformis TaxID=1610 RepID=UPI00201A24A9|nr:terminase TerL endonuclease subunit [Loigolactobacillus coryniformis]MCL5457611.1 terminase large subunit [Loigolactobacillus coryniformis]